MYTCYIQQFKFLASNCSWAGWFESYLVENPRRHVFALRGSIVALPDIFSIFKFTQTYRTFLQLITIIIIYSLHLQFIQRGENVTTIMILSFRTDMPGRTVQTQIRLLLVWSGSTLFAISVCIVWTHYSMVEPHSSDFRVIRTNCLGVRIFRKFTVP